MIVWTDGNRNMTCLLGLLDEKFTNTSIDALEAAAGRKGEWEWSDEHADLWHGLTGTFNGVLFTVYTHKSGRLHIGGHPDGGLDVHGVRMALKALPGVA